MSLVSRAKEFIAGGGNDYALLHDCVIDGGSLALAAVMMIAEDSYGGHAFYLMIKAPAAIALIAFGERGLIALVEIARRSPTIKNVSLCLSTLGSVAAGASPQAFDTHDEQIRTAVAKAAVEPGMQDAARKLLREYVLTVEDEDDIVRAFGLQFISSLHPENVDFTGELFAALAARQVATGPKVIEAYERLLRDQQDNEPALHTFFTRHPQLLDPAAAEIWSKPDLAGVKEPDFVLRRSDDSYLVIEIETPGKLLVTESGQLSAVATQAISQATAYRSFLVERFPLASSHFPRFSEPDCLVVIGNEQGLSASQSAALARDNRSRAGLRIVGFDWLARRATAIFRNVVEARLTSKSIRVY